MASCEKCWGDAFMRTLEDCNKDQSEHYRDLLKERKDNPCSLKEQAGQWWDEEKQIDERAIIGKESKNGTIRAGI